MAEEWTILKVLDWTREWFTKKDIDSARLDAELLIAHALGMQRVMLYAHFDQVLAQHELTSIRELVKRRSQREPVAYLTGEREFWSLAFHVDANVLIPRPDTETLIEVCRTLLDGRGAPRIADVGTGSGCIAISLAKEFSSASLVAYEISAPACAVAARNVERHALADRVEIVESNLLDRAAGTFDLIVANLPYIRSAEIATLEADVKNHEPLLALDGGADGLDPIRKLLDTATPYLNPDGAIALEAGFDQLDAVADLARSAGFVDVAITKDYGDNPRVCAARRRAT